jgi:hypothetical protein
MKAEMKYLLLTWNPIHDVLDEPSVRKNQWTDYIINTNLYNQKQYKMISEWDYFMHTAEVQV